MQRTWNEILHLSPALVQGLRSANIAGASGEFLGQLNSVLLNDAPPQRDLRGIRIFVNSTRCVKSSNICKLNEICEVHEYLLTRRDL